jgi:hypothetical protein
MVGRKEKDLVAGILLNAHKPRGHSFLFVEPDVFELGHSQ